MRLQIEIKHIVLLSALVFLIPFENCSQPQSTNSLASISAQDSTPFAYQAKLDTMAYMSCDGSKTQANRAYFNFRAGAYNSASGMGLTSTFFNATKYMTADMRAATLASSSQNSLAYATLSIRQPGSLQTAITNGPGSYVQGIDYDAFLPALSSDQVGGPLASLAQGAHSNYFPGDTSTKRLMEASLNFNQNMTSAFTQDLVKGYELIAGYTSLQGLSDANLRSPADATPNSIVSPNNTVYGMGYQMAFRGSSQRALSGITEVSLDNSQATSGWSCSQTYMIVRLEDTIIGGCKTNCVNFFKTPDPLPPTAAYQPYIPSYRSLRNVMRVEDWAVNLSNPSYGPMVLYNGLDGDHCYSNSNLSPTTGAPLPINYGAGLNCTPTSTYACPHYVTVCTRNN